jgi:hypothetical protein
MALCRCGWLDTCSTGRQRAPIGPHAAARMDPQANGARHAPRATPFTVAALPTRVDCMPPTLRFGGQEKPGWFTFDVIAPR